MKNVLLALCLVCASCSKQEKSDPTKTLRLHFLSEANSLDPRYGYEIPANHAVKMLYEGLMRMTPEGKLVPAAAERYIVSDDGKNYLFYIRPTVWSNGSAVTAFDFEYAWKSILDPSLPTQGGADFYPIKNAEAIIKGDLPLESAGVRALDARLLLVELEYPAPYFLELTSTSAYSPVFASGCQLDPAAQAPLVFNGPFLLKERRPHDATILEKNPHYWNAKEVALDRIEIAVIEDTSTQLALFEKGAADWFGKPFAKLPLDAVSTLENKMDLKHFPERAVYWYFLNTQQFPFDNQKFRRAFALAVDRESIVTHILKEQEMPATSVNRGLSFFQDHNIEEARLLFREALEETHLTTATFPEIKLSYCNIETNCRIATAVQQQWQNAFNIEVKLDPQEWTAYYDNLTSGNFLIGGLSWHSRIRDPLYNLQLFKLAEDRLNISSWESPEFAALIEAACQEVEPQKREALLVKAETLLMEEMPVIPIYFLTISYAHNPQLQRVYISDINEIDFAWASKMQ